MRRWLLVAALIGCSSRAMGQADQWRPTCGDFLAARQSGADMQPYINFAEGFFMDLNLLRASALQGRTIMPVDFYHLIPFWTNDCLFTPGPIGKPGPSKLFMWAVVNSFNKLQDDQQ